MKAARALGATQGRVLKYGHSGEVSGDDDGVVGYLAAAFGTFSDAH
jgi:AmmeMemoRadiSam system protein B